jgi:hypothetical protein
MTIILMTQAARTSADPLAHWRDFWTAAYEASAVGG